MRTPSRSVGTSQRLLATGLLVLLPALASHAEHDFSGKSRYDSGAYQDRQQRSYAGQYNGHRQDPHNQNRHNGNGRSHQQGLDGDRLNGNRRFNDSQRRFDSGRHSSQRFGLRSGSGSFHSRPDRDRRSNFGDRGNRSQHDNHYPYSRSYDNGTRYQPRFDQRSSHGRGLSLPKPFRRDRNPYGNRR